MKRTIEIDDTLEGRVNDAKEELRENIRSWIEKEKPNEDIEIDAFLERWYQGEDGETYGGDIMSEIADSNTPIYYSEIDGLYYLYADELEEAYNNAGFGRGDEDNHRQIAIYCYISQALHESYSDIFTQVLEDYQSDTGTKHA